MLKEGEGSRERQSCRHVGPSESEAGGCEQKTLKEIADVLGNVNRSVEKIYAVVEGGPNWAGGLKDLEKLQQRTREWIARVAGVIGALASRAGPETAHRIDEIKRFHRFGDVPLVKPSRCEVGASLDQQDENERPSSVSPGR